MRRRKHALARSRAGRLALFAMGVAVTGPTPAEAKPLPERRTEAWERGYVGPDLVPPPQRPWEALRDPGVRYGPLVVRSRGRARRDRSSRPPGFLLGKSIYLSPGHGWTYTGWWRTQRGNTNGLVEDLSNVEAVSQFLMPYLWRASAHVVPVREIDMTTDMVILDDGDDDLFPGSGLVEELGDAGVYSDSTLAGYGRFTAPLLNGDNVFAMGGNRLLETAATETARVRYTLAVPADGFYHVYVSYSAFSGRASDAHYIVVHPGGEAHFRVDQRRHGATWVLLGRFWFAAGTDPARGAVVLANDSADAGSNVSADAVRLGGGMGVIDRGGGVSGYPRYEENARYSAQFSGAPLDVYDRDGDPSGVPNDASDDVGTRSRMAAWVHEAGEDAVYFSWHSNAGGGTGTSIYVYGDGGPGVCTVPSPVAGSVAMADFIIAEVVGDIRAVWDAGWTDRGRRCAWFGELNPANNNETPAALIEVAFHDLAADADDLREAEFRRIVARGIYQGMVRYFADRDQVTPVFLPEPPTMVAAQNVAVGSARVSWAPPAADAAGGDPPTSYRVYQSPNGVAWDEGVDVGSAQELVLDDLGAGEVRFFHVTAVNAGGESLPSAVVAVGASPTGRAPVLVITAFDRLDGTMVWKEDKGGALGVVDRVVLSRMRDPAIVRRHGPEIMAWDVPFDTAHHDAAAGLTLSDYDMVDYAAGRGVDASRSLTVALRDQLSSFVAAGGNLLVSGSHVAGQLAGAGGADSTFLADALGLSGAAPGASYDVVPVATQLFDGIGAWTLHDGNGDGYDVGTSDQLTPGTAVGIADSAGAPVAVRSANAPPAASVGLGFAFEGIRDPVQREEVMGRILTFLRVQPPTLPDAGVPGPDGAVTTADAGVTPPPGGEGKSGCGCRAGSSDAGGPLVLLLLFVGWGWRRRRR